MRTMARDGDRGGTLRGVLLKGNGLGVLARDVGALAVFAAAVLSLALWRFRRRLS